MRGYHPDLAALLLAGWFVRWLRHAQPQEHSIASHAAPTAQVVKHALLIIKQHQQLCNPQQLHESLRNSSYSSSDDMHSCVLLQERVAEEASNQRPCPSCNGSGYEPCLCNRWSDGDTGCNTCHHTGYMRCRSCGGGGRAIPIKATVSSRGP